MVTDPEIHHVSNTDTTDKRTAATTNLRVKAERAAERLGATIDHKPGGGYLVRHPSWSHARPCATVADVMLTLSYMPNVPPRQAGEPAHPDDA